MLYSIKERFEDLETSKTLAVSTFLIPRFKHVGLSTEAVANPTKKLIINMVAHKMIEEKPYQENEIDPSVPSTSNQVTIEKKIYICSHSEDKAATFHPSGTSPSLAVVEVQRYLEDELLA
ncbi:unnamed protein product [Diabrotica balteata]|uniref:Uncharacterized protein n=1 Tax=Diabrotica balteata TaxID=107213 RepID=A0A9N9XIH2_DIABA|nr:unnamed protein product [Diabrotica balteata]